MTYDLNDLQIDAHDLHELLETTYAIIHEMPYERDGKRDRELDQVASLLRIARDFAERTADAIDSHFRDIGSTWKGRAAEAEAEKGGEA